MPNGKLVSLEDRIPKLKEQRKRKTNRRLTFLISVFFLLILLVVYFQSPLSHVSDIEIEGNEIVNNKSVIEKSGLSGKTNIWNVDKHTIVKQLLTIPEIKHASVKIKFPNKINIHVQEHDSIAYISNGTSLSPVLENGKILKNGKDVKPTNLPILTNFQKGKILDEMVDQLQQLPSEIINSISEIHYEPLNTDQYHLTLFMNDGFEVSATMRTLADKIIHYPSIISQLGSNVKGVIDLEVGSYFKPYKTEGEQKDEKQEGER